MIGLNCVEDASMEKTYHQPLGGNKMPRFGGPATMMRLPAVSSAKGLDAAFVGVPFDIGTSNRSGARFGPRQIRAESCLIRPYNMATRAAPFDSLSVADIGDVAINTFNLEKSIAIIEAAYDEILSHNCIPMTIGGDPHHRPADPARAEEEIRAGRHGAYRRPRRHQRLHVRRDDRPRHAVPPRGRGRACSTASAWRRSASGATGYSAEDFDWPRSQGFRVVQARSAGTSPSPR
jgi:guanidinobutyrase